MVTIRRRIRNVIWTYLKEHKDLQIAHIGCEVDDKIGREEAKKNANIIMEELYDLLSKGLIIFWNGEHATNNPQGYPFITLTEYGKKCLDAESLLPFDPDGYIDKIKKMVLGIDDIMLKYLGESIGAFNRYAPISATITLGIASEQLMLLLIEAYIGALKKNKEKDNLINKIKNRFIETQYIEFRKSLESHKNSINKEIIRDVDVWLDGTFCFIKMLRNEQGHPTYIEVDNDTVYANLQQFPHYSKKTFRLIEWLKNNKI